MLDCSTDVSTEFSTLYTLSDSIGFTEILNLMLKESWIFHSSSIEKLGVCVGPCEGLTMLRVSHYYYNQNSTSYLSIINQSQYFYYQALCKNAFPWWDHFDIL